MDLRPDDDPDIWDAIRRGKLIVRGASGDVYYGEDLLDEYNECLRNGKPFPGVVVSGIINDEQWEAFAEHYQLQPTTDAE